jgi:hypothetical protein
MREEEGGIEGGMGVDEVRRSGGLEGDGKKGEGGE